MRGREGEKKRGRVKRMKRDERGREREKDTEIETERMNRRAAETKERKTGMREGCPERWTDRDEREAGHGR